MLLLGAGEREEGLGRPEFVMRRRRRRVRILAILAISPREIIENKKDFPYGPFGRNFPNPDLAEKSSFPNGKSKNEFFRPGDWLILSRVYVIGSCASLQLGFPFKILYG